VDNSTASPAARRVRPVRLGGICLATLWSLPAVIAVRSGSTPDPALLAVAGVASLVVAGLALGWKRSAETGRAAEFRVAALSRELAAARDAARLSDERLAERSQELSTELLRARRELERFERQDRRKTDLLGSFGDSVRTPMHRLLTAVDAMIAEEDDETRAEGLSELRRQAVTLLGFSDDVIDFSEIEADRLSLREESFAVRDLVEEALDCFGGSHDRCHESSYVLDPDLPETLRADPNRVRQVLCRLLVRAASCTDEDELHVRVEPVDSADGSRRVRFAVFPPSVDGASEDFDTEAGSREPEDGVPTGAGLGVAISRRLVERMGGSLGSGPDTHDGFPFWFTIGLRPGDAVKTRRVEKELSGARVLVISASSHVRLMLIQQTRQWKCVPSASADGPSALAALRAAATAGDPFRAVVLDVDLPGASGVQLAESVRADSTFGGPAVLIMASGSDGAARAEIDAAGLPRPIPKPVRHEVLREQLLRVLRQRSAHPAPSHVDDAVERIAPAVQAAAADAASDSDDRACTRDGRILVVDDNPVNRRVATLILQRAGYTPEIAEDGQIAVEKIEAEETFDLILMDVHMPRLNGFEATARIRALDDDRKVTPIVAMTASAMSGDAERCLEAGMDGYVSKPVKADALVAVVESWIPDTDPDDEVVDAPVSAKSKDPLDDEVTLEPGGLDELVSLAGDDTSMLDELVQTFFETAAEHLETMRTSYADGDLRRVAESAHALRGSAGTLGARRLHGMSGRLEDRARESGATVDVGELDAIEAEITSVRAAIERRLGAQS